MADEWRKTSSLAASLVAGESAASEEQYVVLLGSLTGCNYPVEGLLAAVSDCMRTVHVKNLFNTYVLFKPIFLSF